MPFCAEMRSRATIASCTPYKTFQNSTDKTHLQRDVLQSQQLTMVSQVDKMSAALGALIQDSKLSAQDYPTDQTRSQIPWYQIACPLSAIDSNTLSLPLAYSHRGIPGPRWCTMQTGNIWGFQEVEALEKNVLQSPRPIHQRIRSDGLAGPHSLSAALSNNKSDDQSVAANLCMVKLFSGVGRRKFQEFSTFGDSSHSTSFSRIDQNPSSKAGSNRIMFTHRRQSYWRLLYLGYPWA